MTVRHIYFLQASTGPIKIGSTIWLDTRLRSLQTWCPYPTDLIASLPGTEEQEIWLHFEFEAYRLRGEWFHPVEPILTAAQEIARTGKLAMLPVLPSRRDQPAFRAVMDTLNLTKDEIRALGRYQVDASMKRWHEGTPPSRAVVLAHRELARRLSTPSTQEAAA